MKREIAAALIAFAACWGIGASTACSFGDDCDCPAPVPNPERQASRSVTFSTFDDDGNSARPPIFPTNPTIEVTPERVVIRYEIYDEEFEIGYQVVGP